MSSDEFFCSRCKTYKTEEQLAMEFPNGRCICNTCQETKDKYKDQRKRNKKKEVAKHVKEGDYQ